MTRQPSSRGPARDRAVDAVFAPDSVAIVGASDDPAKWGHILARRALTSERTRPVLLINRSATTVLGRPAHRSLADARRAHGRPLDLVVVCVPGGSFVATVADAVAAGARAIVAITAGLAEQGPEGARQQAEAVALASAGGAVLVGPNCLGVVDTGTHLQLAHAELPAGDIAVLSQSGNLVLDLAAHLAERGLGVSRFCSLGNQADVDIVDLLRSCRHHAPTRAVAVYLEDFVDGPGFVAAARALTDAGKPVVLLAPGRSEAAARSAVSHTGSMTSPERVVEAMRAATGVHRAEHPAHLAHLLEGLLTPRRLAGDRIAVLTDGGGHGAVAADAVATAGLTTPALGEHTRARLRGVLWATSGVGNPVDLAGAGDSDPGRYASAVEVLLASDEVDGVLLTGYFGGYSTASGRLGELEVAAAHAMVAAARAGTKPVVAHTIYPVGATADVLRAGRIPVHRDIDRAAAVLAGLREPALLPLPPAGSPRPEPAAPPADTGYAAARALFTEAGLPFPAARVVHDRDAATAAMREIGFPLVLKALGRVHKSEGGGVVLGLTDESAALAAYDDLVARLAPPAVSVEAMAGSADGSADASGVEVIVGAVRDRTFGPVVMVGLGGVFAEVLDDTACALAPVDAVGARRLLLSLRGAPLLTGARGRRPVHLDALAEAVAAVSRVAAANPGLAELEVNPLLAGPAGVLALDARIVAAQPSTSRR